MFIDFTWLSTPPIPLKSRFYCSFIVFFKVLAHCTSMSIFSCFFMDSDMFLDAFWHNISTFCQEYCCIFCWWCFWWFFILKSVLKWAKNRPIELPMVPKAMKIPYFSWKGLFGSILTPFGHFWTSHLTSFRPIRGLF